MNEPQQEPAPSPYGPYPGPGRWPSTICTPSSTVTIKTVANGWIVTAPEADDDDYFEGAERRVYQFSQKQAMIDFVGVVTPARKPSAPEIEGDEA